METSLLTKRDTEFATVMQAQWANVRQTLWRRGIRGADLDDLTQVVFIVAFENPKKVPEDLEKRGAWFVEVAKRRAAEWHGAPWNRRQVSVDQEDLADLRGISESSIEAAAILSEMLQRLPERYHEIVRLRAEQYEIHEIAETLGIPWSTANSRCERACEVATCCGYG